MYLFAPSFKELSWPINFGPKMVHLPQRNVSKKTVNIIVMHLLELFIMQNFKKKPLTKSKVMTSSHFWPKIAQLP